MVWVTDLNELPTSPKRLAKAAEESGWKWNASYASGTVDGVLVDSLVVRTAGESVRVSARWESVDGGKLGLATCQCLVPGAYPELLGFNDAVAFVRANAVVS